MSNQLRTAVFFRDSAGEAAVVQRDEPQSKVADADQPAADLEAGGAEGRRRNSHVADAGIAVLIDAFLDDHCPSAFCICNPINLQTNLEG